MNINLLTPSCRGRMSLLSAGTNSSTLRGCLAPRIWPAYCVDFVVTDFWTSLKIKLIMLNTMWIMMSSGPCLTRPESELLFKSGPLNHATAIVNKLNCKIRNRIYVNKGKISSQLFSLEFWKLSVLSNQILSKCLLRLYTAGQFIGIVFFFREGFHFRVTLLVIRLCTDTNATMVSWTGMRRIRFTTLILE